MVNTDEANAQRSTLKFSTPLIRHLACELFGSRSSTGFCDDAIDRELNFCVEIVVHDFRQTSTAISFDFCCRSRPRSNFFLSRVSFQTFQSLHVGTGVLTCRQIWRHTFCARETFINQDFT